MSRYPHGPERSRLALVTAALLLLPVAAGAWTVATAQEALPLTAVPKAKCGPGSLPETGLQGRIPPADIDSGRAAKGYTCNAVQIGAFRSSAGWRVERYGDCAYYNGEPNGVPLPVPTTPAGTPAGTFVMDVSNPARPVRTAVLNSTAMNSPHESMNLSQVRGLLVATTGNSAFGPGAVDVYDVATDCRKPKLLSSINLGAILGHEGGLSPDGKTFYVGSASSEFLTAVDLTDPAHPAPVATFKIRSHGLSVSADGTRLYDTISGGADLGMVIFDVSRIQNREPNAAFKILSKMTWPEVSIPQSTIPVSIGGKPYVIESDEFTNSTTGGIGASRIIDIADDTAPRVISHLRLEVHQPEHAEELSGDPGLPVLGRYSGHYCSVPRLVDPEIVACSMLRSGVRVFDIRNPAAPREVAYFNPPAGTAGDGRGSALHTGSTVAFVPARKELWISGQQSGFHVIRLTNGVWGSAAAAPPRARPAAPSAPAQAGVPAPPVTAAPSASAKGLPATGAAEGLAAAAILLLGSALVLSRREQSEL